MSKLLIISPRFHGYYASVARGFEQIGYDVETYCYDAVRSAGEKAWNKIRHELPAQLGRGDGHLSVDRVVRRTLGAVRSGRWDHVLVIRGDIFPEPFWAEVAAIVPDVGVWIYDEIRRTAFDPKMVSTYALIATYSRDDATSLSSEGICTIHVENAFDPHRRPSTTNLGENVFSFIGAPFDRRTSALTEMHEAGLPVRAWGRGWSDHPLDMLRTWRRTSLGIPSGRDVPYADALAIMRNSLATLNIHGDQDGFTMRTFESSGWGALQIVDRPDVAPLYEPGREILVYETLDELLEIAERVRRAPDDFADVREDARRRTLAEHTFAHRARLLETLWT